MGGGRVARQDTNHDGLFSMDDSKKPRPMPLPASPFVSPARSLADLAAKPIAGLLGKRGLAGGDIVAHWTDIVGADLADCCAVEKIVWPRPAGEAQDGANSGDQGAVLHLRVEGPRAIEVQHRADEIMARVNQMFGFAVIGRLRILQAPLARRETPAARKAAAHRPAGLAPQPKQDRGAAGGQDALAQALARLGTAIRGREH